MYGWILCIFIAIAIQLAIQFLCHYAGAVEDQNPLNIYLIVQGSFNLLHLMLYISLGCLVMKNDKSGLSDCLGFINGFLVFFLIAWTIAGSIWVWESLDDWQHNRSSYSDVLFISATMCVSLHYVVLLLMCCCYVFIIVSLCLQ